MFPAVGILQVRESAFSSKEACRLTSLIVIPSDDVLIIVVRRIAMIDTIRAILQFQIVKLPKVGLLDMEYSTIGVGYRRI